MMVDKQLADGTINLHGEFSFFNSAQSVINNHGTEVRNDPVGEAAPWSFSGGVNNMDLWSWLSRGRKFLQFRHGYYSG